MGQGAGSRIGTGRFQAVGQTGFSLYSPHLGDVGELQLGLADVDLGPRHLHEAHVRTLGARGVAAQLAFEEQVLDTRFSLHMLNTLKG
jgi:hypothetical protein